MNTETDNPELAVHNAVYVERLLRRHIAQGEELPQHWQAWLKSMTEAGNGADSPLQPQQKPLLPRRSIFHLLSESSQRSIEGAQRLQQSVDAMLHAFRAHGHLQANLDPLGAAASDTLDLSPQSFGIRTSELRQPVFSDLGRKQTRCPVNELHARLKKLYCDRIGYQWTHLEDGSQRDWLLERVENLDDEKLTSSRRHRILKLLTEAVVFEEFMRKKYLGAKTFSLEGAESLIPLLDLAIELAAGQGVREIVIGMPHRGRLNVLANIVGQPAREIFAQFEDNDPEQRLGGGDVKYHLGASGDRSTAAGDEVHISLCFNPSHVEFVNPVALGRVRAKQDRSGDADRRCGMSLLIHGDAAMAGEGIVQESLNLSGLDGYTTGGTLHVVLNNQLGFTTRPRQGRSATYPSDVAKAIQAPIFHVNGEHPEAVARAVRLAIAFRHAFQRDVVIDLFCFRRHGHNEADEPSFTQPEMYQAIEHHQPLNEVYRERLSDGEKFSADSVEAIAQEHRSHLKQEHKAAQEVEAYPQFSPAGVWEGYFGGPAPEAGSEREEEPPETSFDKEQLSRLLHHLTEVPEGFHRHRKLERSVQQRRKMADGEAPLDWSAAEALALATLAAEGHRVRLSGQDSERGTFSQRHAVLHDTVDGRRYEVFSELTENQTPVEIINSPLSEAGVLGFEYGFSLDYPDALVVWEAQFGDFANAAQVITDQFIASAEDKWNRLSGIVLLLPHGFEGQGPEHSSARLERFLALAAEDNLQVCYPSTPAQYFHLLRRQAKRRWRKPLVVLTPKSLLRHPQAVSGLEELASGRFSNALPDDRADPEKTTRTLLCSGKIYYELAKHRRENERDDVAIVRIEQLYPSPEDAFALALKAHDGDSPLIWVQEEPINMGAWPHWRTRLGHSVAEHPLQVVARPASASPATGSKGAHKLEQRRLVERAFNDEEME